MRVRENKYLYLCLQFMNSRIAYIQPFCSQMLKYFRYPYLGKTMFLYFGW